MKAAIAHPGRGKRVRLSVGSGDTPEVWMPGAESPSGRVSVK